MKLFNTQQIQAKGKGAKAFGSNMLDVLGNHKHLTPEQMKALKAKGKLNTNPEAFETLLKDSKNQLASKKQTVTNKSGAQTLAKQIIPNNLKAAPKQPTLIKNAGVQAKSQTPQHAQKTVMNQSSKLVDFNSFMKKQSPQAKTRIQANQASYAKKNAHKSMFKAKIDESLPHVAKKPVAQTKLQDVMFKSGDQSADMNMTPEQQFSNQQLLGNTAKVATAGAAIDQTAKVFDMNQIPTTASADEVIAKIQDYAIQTKVNNEPQLDFSFRHQDLGQVDLTIQKAGGDQLNILVGANSTEAMKFFTQNQGELLQSLTQAGVSVADFKLDSSSKSNNQNLSQNSNGNNQDTHKQHQSESGQRQEEQQRRSELWDQLKDKEAA